MFAKRFKIFKKYLNRQRSLSAKNLQERMYDTLPKSLKSEVLVKSKVEDPDKREERRKLTQVSRCC